MDNELQDVIVAAARHFSGPLPPPEHYERYAEIIPNGANRIMVMAEEEQKQRHRMETYGMASAFIIALAFLIAGVILVLAGHDWAGTTIVVGTVVALASVFVTGQVPDLLRRFTGGDRGRT